MLSGLARLFFTLILVRAPWCWAPGCPAGRLWLCAPRTVGRACYIGTIRLTYVTRDLLTAENRAPTEIWIGCSPLSHRSPASHRCCSERTRPSPDVRTRICTVLCSASRSEVARERVLWSPAALTGQSPSARPLLGAYSVPWDVGASG